MLIENPKTYKGTELETIFFRPTFCGKSAEELGIRVIYNMPLPTTVQVWSHARDVLQPFECGWSGGANATKLQKTINMTKVKAETRFSAEDYFSMIYEKITNSGDVCLEDLTGTELEKVETELFRQAIGEAVRATMWIGDTKSAVSDYNLFNGFLANIKEVRDDLQFKTIADKEETPTAIEMFKDVWDMATPELKALRSEGQLAFFVSSDVYNNYIEYLDQKGADSAYNDLINGHASLCYHGIPIVEVPLGKYRTYECSTFCLLTDRRNLVLALNTADMPENEVRMWYNPDQMENRQRAVFLIGADIIDPQLVSIEYSLF